MAIFEANTGRFMSQVTDEFDYVHDGNIYKKQSVSGILVSSSSDLPL